MNSPIRFPLRLKMLVGLLLVVTVVVAVITYTMADIFRRDKSTYIHDLTSIMAFNLAAETRSVLEGYRERLTSYIVILEMPDLTETQKVAMINRIIRDFGEFVAISVHDDEGRAVSTIYDSEALTEAGLSKDALGAYREENPLPVAAIRRGQFYVRNSSVDPDLPSIIVAMATTMGSSSDTVMVSAVLRADRLAGLVGNTGPFAAVVLDHEGAVIAPSTGSGDLSVAWLQETVRKRTVVGGGTTREYHAGEVAMVGGVVPIGVGDVYAGVQIPMSAAFLVSRDLMKNLGLVSLILLIGATLISIALSRRLTLPIERLSQATRKVGQGQFDVQVETSATDEIGALAHSFNTMASELQAREHALAETQEQLIRSEKMAAFGQLGAGIAHEVKNPLAGILGCAQLSIRMIEKGTKTEENIQLIIKETKRCKEIIENLLRFSREDKAIMTMTALGMVVDDAVAIVRHQLELSRVRIEQDLPADLPMVMVNANQIQQVLMNLLMNAQQAMEGNPGNIRVGARVAGGDRVEIRVTDDGPGIPPENQKKIFDPFFTTKPQGKGTGLGLSVSYKIIKDHGGEIRIDSTVGKGTTFIIDLPLPSACAGADSAEATSRRIVPKAA